MKLSDLTFTNERMCTGATKPFSNMIIPSCIKWIISGAAAPKVPKCLQRVQWQRVGYFMDNKYLALNKATGEVGKIDIVIYSVEQDSWLSTKLVCKICWSFCCITF